MQCMIISVLQIKSLCKGLPIDWNIEFTINNKYSAQSWIAAAESVVMSSRPWKNPNFQGVYYKGNWSFGEYKDYNL